MKLPVPLFQDPIYGAPADPVIIWNEEESCWCILYTQRRLGPADVGVSGVHGSKIGLASSKDMTKWLYRGVLPSLDIEAGHNTFWAPELIRVRGKYHLYVSYITGVPADWNYERHILHYSADNLWNWKYEGVVPLSSDRVIDPCVYEISPGTFKMWYKDEEHQSHSFAAISKDLYAWTVTGEEIADCDHEGPNVFELAGYKWMITDCWDGLGVYRSDDFCHWTRQKGNLLKKPGTREADNDLGHHADVLVNGGRACILYFVHHNREAPLPFQRDATVIQAAELQVRDGILCCDRDAGYETAL
jgi:hypothetical protein